MKVYQVRLIESVLVQYEVEAESRELAIETAMSANQSSGDILGECGRVLKSCIWVCNENPSSKGLDQETLVARGMAVRTIHAAQLGQGLSPTNGDMERVVKELFPGMRPEETVLVLDIGAGRNLEAGQ